MNFEHSISKVILDLLLSQQAQIAKLDHHIMLTIINEYLEAGDIILILDAIDESIFKDDELEKFRNNLIHLGYPIITSIRLEFHEFIDKAKEFEEWQYIAVEIKEWDKKILNNYLSAYKIEQKTRDLIYKYNNLNKRPIFVNLLKNHIVNPNIQLSNNVASLYYHTINQAIDFEIQNVFPDEIQKNIKLIKKEYFDLLNRIAISIYLEFQHYKYEINYKSKPSVIFNSDNLRLLVSQNKILDFEKLKLLLDSKYPNSYKIIRPIDNIHNGYYTFYHRSFFEYLVANGAANRIVKEKKCSDAWDVYQTDEVSDYFVQEVERILREDNNSQEIYDNFFLAFRSEFLELQTRMKDFGITKSETYSNDEYLFYNIRNKIDQNEKIVNYSERHEEVIYYIGKFQDFWNSEQKSIFNHFCKFIYYNKHSFDPVFNRTCAITLSRLNDNSFLFTYLSNIIRDYISRDKIFFYTQVEKDTRYYGKEQLEEKCFRAYEEILHKSIESELIPLEILKIFSLFISIRFDKSQDGTYRTKQIKKIEYSKSLTMLSNLKDNCSSKGFVKTLELIEGIEYVLNDITFNQRISDISLEQELRKAIQNRSIFTNSDMYRIVNSTGDNLEGLTIDNYCGHFIIEITKEVYYENKDLILFVIKDMYINRIKSISIKYNEKFEISSRHYGEIFETLYGYLPEKIECNEIIKLLITPKANFPKTGFFIDNRNIRYFLNSHSRGKRILNLCAFTCSLGAIAKNAGAIEVINVEKNINYIYLGKEIYKLNNIPFADNEFVEADVVEYIESANNDQRKFDIIIQCRLVKIYS